MERDSSCNKDLFISSSYFLLLYQLLLNHWNGNDASPNCLFDQPCEFRRCKMPPLCGKRRCKSWVFCCLLNDRKRLRCLDMFKFTIPVEGMADKSSTMILLSLFFLVT